MDCSQGGIVAAGIDRVVENGNLLGFRGTPAALVEFQIVALGEVVVAGLTVSEGLVVELSGLVEADLLVDESSGLVFEVGLDSVG